MTTISSTAANAGILAFVFTMVHSGLTDLTTLKIRNWIVVLSLLAYAVLAPLAGFDLRFIGWSAAAAAAILAIGFLFFALGWMGGGDAKLAALTVLWCGAGQTATYLIYTALLGGVLAAALLVFRARPVPARAGAVGWVACLHSRQCGVPYGVAMAPAGLVAFQDTRWLSTSFL
jgi:prepilin peptidase CpaA